VLYVDTSLFDEGALAGRYHLNKAWGKPGTRIFKKILATLWTILIGHSNAFRLLFFGRRTILAVLRWLKFFPLS
jgi:hypothetical protein